MKIPKSREVQETVAIFWAITNADTGEILDSQCLMDLYLKNNPDLMHQPVGLYCPCKKCSPRA